MGNINIQFKRLFFFFVLQFICTNMNLSAQIRIHDFPPGYNKIEPFEREPGLDGTPWHTKSFLPGIVTLKGGVVIKDLEYRYNVYRNLLYFRVQGLDYEITNPDSIETLKMDNKIYSFINHNPEKQGLSSLMEIVIEGKSSLFVKFFSERIPPNKTNATLGYSPANEKIIIKEQYLLKVDNKYFPIDKKGLTIFEALADRKKEIENFVKKDKLSFSKRDDIVKLVKYYNSL